MLLHAALFFALSRAPSAQRPNQASREVVELEFLQPSPKTPVPAAPNLTGQPSDRASAPPKRRVERPTPAARRETPPPQVATAAPESGASPQDAPSAAEVGQGGEGDELTRLGSDIPYASAAKRAEAERAAAERAAAERRAAADRPILVPGNLLGDGLTGKPPSTGRTVHNTGEPPDPKAIARQQAEAAREKVDGWARDTLAEARAESGAPDPYFAKLQKDFSKKLVNPPPPDLKVLASRMKREQVEAIQRFGKTGSPYTPKERDHRLEQRNRFQAAVEAGRAANMFMVDVTEPILALAAVVEVRQARDGKVLGLEVIEGSGDPKFDEWAVSQLREALAQADAPEDSGVGIHDDGMRSRWRLKEFLGNPRVQIHLIGVY